MAKLGGNYTQPHFDPFKEEVTFQVFVGWHLYGTYPSDAEAVAALKEAVCPSFDRVGAFAKVVA